MIISKMAMDLARQIALQERERGMPLYEYKDTVSGKKVEILRNFSEYKIGPTEEEAIKAGLTPEEAVTALWERVIGSGIKVVKGENWGAGKGHW